MPKLTRPLAPLLILLAMAAPAVLSQSSGRVTEADRKAFIETFQRTGLNTTAGDAMLLRVLIDIRGAKRGVEVGSATGFGAINMGVAFERNRGRLFTVDIDPDMVRKTQEAVRKMGLEDTVTALEGDALKVLPTLTGEFDFVFIDALKRDYLKYFRAIEPKLAARAVVVADNVIQSANDMKDFLDFMKHSPDWEVTIVRASVEKNDGMAICYKLR